MSYFSVEQFFREFPDIAYDSIETIQTDTYDENAISLKIKTLEPDVCFGIALQFVLIGFGRKTYGKIRYNGREIDIKEYFDKNGINYKSTLKDQLKPDELTPRRLVRFFRYAIEKYIGKTHRTSYLQRKYCPIKNEKTALFVFPGYEHICEPEKHKDQAALLIKTYMLLDSRQQTNICERIIRVLLARGFTNDFIENVKKNQ